MSKIIRVQETVVKCDGTNQDVDDSSLGHPAVYLNMGDNKEVECPYCGCKFILT